MAHNDEMNLAWQYLQGTNTSVFLTGNAGTGKTTFLRKIRELSPKRMVVLAPTGVAAINAAGQTIHSFFQLPFSPYIPGIIKNDRKVFRLNKDKKNLIRTMDLLVIDEISMVRADLLDAIDDVMRRYREHNKPFGGVQLLLIGDLQQLSPVVKDDEWRLLSEYYSSPYFFCSKALQSLSYVTIELKTVYRQQSDAEFVNILSKVRNNILDQETLSLLNSRYIPSFKEPQGGNWIHLTTHNRKAQEYNDKCLSELQTTAKTFTATIKGNFPEYSYPTDMSLTLKLGAQVMFVKNDISPAHLYFNGKIGVVTKFVTDGVMVKCSGDDKEIYVSDVEWENMKYAIDGDTKEITETVDGTFSQLPLRLAWAITIHKSQGLTFDHAVLDINQSFAHGQVYVALSRCRSLEGVVLSHPISLTSIINDKQVDDFIAASIADSRCSEQRLPAMRISYYTSLLDELFTFSTLMGDIQHLYRVACNILSNISPLYIDNVHAVIKLLEHDFGSVAEKFRTQYHGIIGVSRDVTSDEYLKERIAKASSYFVEKLDKPIANLLDISKLPIENKQHKRQFDIAIDALRLSFAVKRGTLMAVMKDGFSISGFLQAKAVAAINIESSPTKSRSTQNRYPSRQNGRRKDWGTRDKEKADFKRILEEKSGRKLM